MIVNIKQVTNGVNISYVDSDSKIKLLEIPLMESDYYNWDYSSRPNNEKIISWDNKPIYKRNSNFLNIYRIDEIIYNLPQQWKSKLKEYNVPSKFYFDIETAWDEVHGWSKAENATNPVLTLSGVNSQNESVLLGLKKLSRDDIMWIEQKVREYTHDETVQFKYLYFESEKEMINYFFKEFLSKYDLLTGWNVIGYDWTYLWNRSKILSCREINKVSPIGQFLEDNNNLPIHKMIVDYLEIYKKWDRTVEIKENNTLDYVALNVLGHQKLKMPKPLQEMYEHDFLSYCAYNMIDSILVKKIDEKIDTMGTFLGLGNLCLSEYYKTFSPIWLTERVMHEEYINRDRRFVSKKFQLNSQGGYEGAFVKDPIPGFYRWTSVFDFMSLYPTTQRQFNMSPESYLGKFIPDENDKTKILCASGAVFDSTEDSCMRTVLVRLFNARRETKNIGKEYEKTLELLKEIKNGK